jgi:hypothetical protein
VSDFEAWKRKQNFESKNFYELGLEKIPDAPTFATRIPKEEFKQQIPP